MPIEIVIPRLGWNMDEGVFVGWLKQDGEAVRAGEPGIDWTRLDGTGRTGRIRKADVLAAARERRPVDEPAPTAGGRSVPLSPARRATAARMRESLQATAPVTLTTTVDATNLVNL